MADGRLRLVAALGLAIAVGFAIGTWRSGAHIDMGRADSTGHGGGSISTDGWTYGFSSDTSWIDNNNSFRDSGLPECLPPESSVEGVRFAWVEVAIEGATWRPVIWIDCRSVPRP